MRFTKANIERLRPPPGKGDHFEWDDATPGFGVRLRGGRRVWVAQIRGGGRTRRLAIGDVAQIELDAARSAARKFFAEATLGKDPVAERAAARRMAANTVGAVIDKYLTARKPVVRSSTFGHLDRYLRRYFVTLHRHGIDAVTKDDVGVAVRDIAGRHGDVSAARARSALSAFFAWAMKEPNTSTRDANPVAFTNVPSDEKPRERTLSPAEVRAIWGALPVNEFGQIARLIFWTACRRSEIGSLEWSEVDLDRALLTIAAHKMKGGRAHMLPLVPEAVELLRSIAQRPGNPFVFGTGKRGFSGFGYYLAELRRALAATGDVTEHWGLHDVRRTVRTELGDLGVEPWIAETITAHKRAGIEGIYNKAKLERQMRQALSLWAERLHRIVDGIEADSNVVALHR